MEILAPIGSGITKTKTIHKNLKFKNFEKRKQEDQGLGALLDNTADNDHIKLDNREI